MNDAPKTLHELHAEAERIRYDFVKSDLALCLTFADIVETELRFADRKGAEEAFERAESGYESIRSLLSGVRTDERRIELQTDLDRLRKRLNDVAGQFSLTRTSIRDA